MSPPPLLSEAFGLTSVQTTIEEFIVTTANTVGSGMYTYEMDENWAKLPEGWGMPAAAVYGDSKDRVYCFNRDPDHPVVIFDREGNYLSHWGAGVIEFAHAILLGPGRQRLAGGPGPGPGYEVHHRWRTVDDHWRQRGSVPTPATTTPNTLATGGSTLPKAVSRSTSPRALG